MNIQVGLFFPRPNLFNNITSLLSEGKTRQKKTKTKTKYNQVEKLLKHFGKK